MARTTSFAVVAEMNRREYDSNAKWTLKHQPDAPLSQFLQRLPAGRGVVSSMSVEERHNDLHRRARSGLDERRSPSPTMLSGSLPALDSGAALSPSPTTGSRKVHCRRKHRKDCPKHALNDLIASGATTAHSTSTSTALQEGGNRSLDESLRQKASSPLEMLRVPTNRVGRGLANFVGGVFVPQYNARDSSSRLDHPNFAEQEAAKAHRVITRQQTYSPKRDALSPILDEGAVAEVKNYAFHRQKYELKSHIEAMTMLGGAMLRQLSGAAFK